MNDTVISYHDAEIKCHQEGARLLQIRSHAMLYALHHTRPNYFGNGGVFLDYFVGGSFVALGMKYGLLEGMADPTLYFTDRQPLDPILNEFIMENFWTPGHPIEGQECVGWAAGRFLTYPCDQIFNDGTDPIDPSVPALGYICEAKTLHSTDLTSTCIFPFRFQNQTYDSCTFEPEEDINPDGLFPWCAIDVYEDGNAKKFERCQDERHTIISGPGSGHLCPLPFLFEGIWYDHCTRKDPTLQQKYTENYWCPDPRSMNESLTYYPGNPVGRCPEILHPPDNGCAENYLPVSDSVCARLSAHPQSYEDAKIKCNSEGAYLLQYLNTDIEAGLKNIVKNLTLNLPRFQNVDQYWIGAEYRSNGGWKWTDNFQTFSEFKRWEGGEENIGCIGASCTNDYALSVTSFYDTNQDKMFLSWNAHEKENALPYICQSKCPRGFQWFSSIDKCLRVVHSTQTQKHTLGEALFQCSNYNGRLIAPQTCDDITNLMDEVVETFAIPDQIYFTGSFTYRNSKHAVYRNWNSDEAFDS